MMKAFTKIYALGHRIIRELFEDPVEITEKVDGSQIGFGKWDGKLIVRSRNVVFNLEEGAIDGMFALAVNEIQKRNSLIPDRHFFWGEYLKTPRHVTLKYDRVPKGHIALFGMEVDDPNFEYLYDHLENWSDKLGFDVVPLLYYGKIESHNDIKNLMNRQSFLGGPEIEGLVIKNWHRSNRFLDMDIYPLSGKFVSEKFKEVHKRNPSFISSKSNWQAFSEGFATEARWSKAVQHLKEAGKYEGDPRDIGNLIKFVKDDITEECLDDIKEHLWKFFGNDLLRAATRGLPEWYKQQLMEEQFNG